MAKREKNRLYYEITREKPLGNFYMMMVGGTAGALLAFLIVTLMAVATGFSMDALVLAFLLSSLIGFFFGAVVMWAGIKYFGKLVSGVSWIGAEAETGTEAEKPEQVESPLSAVETEATPVVEDEEAKGKSVDFVFPELSPDKQ